MSEITPFIASVLQSPGVQKQQAAEKTSQIRRQQELRRNVAAEGDRYQRVVESPEEIKPIHDERDDARDHRRKRQRHPPHHASEDGDPPPHLDVTA